MLLIFGIGVDRIAISHTKAEYDRDCLLDDSAMFSLIESHKHTYLHRGL